MHTDLPKYISVTDFNHSTDFEKKYRMVNGIPKVDYRFLDFTLGFQYNPVTVSQYALCLYDEYAEEKVRTKRDDFFLQVGWIENNKVDPDGESATVPYHFPHQWYNMKAPWYSGMAQGQVASVLLRAFLLTGDEKYKALAGRFLNFMLKPVGEGGTLAKTPEGDFWIEECRTEKPSLILNGHLYGLIGLTEYCKIDDHPFFRDMRDKITDSTLRLIPLYEKDHWLIYARDVNVNKCNSKYMGLQILEIKHLSRTYRQTGI
ncbi:MAG: D-glucuronyl C5-epimerase family protein [Candidatus Marinimicrobia bacterium]|nr:D-glucuronyl C5-epimerase family protein [Candidatus Neomarinimicrobiota bacterium]